MGQSHIALSASSAIAAIVSQSPYDNDESLFVIQTATGKIVAEPIKATSSGKREVADVSWGPVAGELTVDDQNPKTGKYEVQVLKLNGSVVRTYPAAGTGNGFFNVAPSPSQVLYTSTPSDGSAYNQVWRQSLSGGRPRELEPGPNPYDSPVIAEPWSPAYANFVFADGSGALLITSANGGARHRIPHADGYFPIWVSGL